MTDNSINILIVDDNPINQTFFSMALKKNGFNTSLASSGRDAVNCACEGDFDLILLDIRMPDMDGFEVARKLQSLEVTVPILATSAESISQKDSSEFSDFILKPVSPGDLVNIVTSIVESNQPSGNFDKESALSFCYGDENILRHLVTMFLKEIPLQINALLELIQSEQRDSAKELIHKMRGSCKTCGAIALDQHLSRIDSDIIDTKKIQADLNCLKPALKQFESESKL